MRSAPRLSRRGARRCSSPPPRFVRAEERAARTWLGRIFASQARYAEAESALEKIGPLRTWTPAMAALGFAYAKAGRTADAQRILDEFTALTRSGRYVSSYAIAVVYAGLGDKQHTLSALDAAVRERAHWLVWLERDPRLSLIRSDPRFRQLVKMVGLPS